MFIKSKNGTFLKTLITGFIFSILISLIFIYLLADHNWQMSWYSDGEYHDNLPIFFKFFTVMVLGVIPLSLLTGFLSAYWINKNKDISKESSFTILFDCFIYSTGSGFIGGIMIWTNYSILSELFSTGINILMLPINIVVTFIAGTLFFVPVSCVFALMTMTGGMIFAIIHLTYLGAKRLLISRKTIND